MVIFIELGENSLQYSHTRNQLADLVKRNLKSINSASSTAPHLQLRDSVDVVRIRTGNNEHIFNKGEDF
jgi:hypothetical protein